MATGISTTASGDSSPLSELRMVLLGKIGAGKSKVANAILKRKGEKSGLCGFYEGEQAGRKICVVDTPGWDRISVHRTPENIKKAIVRSVLLCPPGPHALLLVIPVKLSLDKPSASEMKATEKHMELLSKRVWKHTIVLFACDEGVEESTIEEHKQQARKILEKCAGRFHVLQSRTWESPTHICELLKKTEQLVKENCGDVFISQMHHELIERNTPKDILELKRKYEEREEQIKRANNKKLDELMSVYKKQDDEHLNRTDGQRKRSGSLQGLPPEMEENKGHPDVQNVDLEALKRKYREEMLTLLRYYLKPVAVIFMAIIGALVGSVAGSVYGVFGACFGIVVGILVPIPLTFSLIGAAELAKDRSRRDIQTK
ncbi:GTPase IMAP family member 4-like [Xyrauchen texanus]|uniref:GTPase IMAP family member 4-like n=1 Tax=Xyrauchen texanus TaxID=154827 RepID=UPI0022424FF5|nr:GTPase IMAP family member 4-like [Xyrauchen texanus]